MKKLLLFVLLVCFIPAYIPAMYAGNGTTIFRAMPFLQSPWDNSIQITWATRVPVHAWLEYGTSKEELQRVQHVKNGIVVANNTLHKFQLNDLRPGTTYFYRAGVREVKKYGGYDKAFGDTIYSPLYSYTCPDDGNSDFTAIIFNDIHQQMATLTQLNEYIKDTPRDLIIFNGDCLCENRNREAMLYILKSYQHIIGISNTPVLYVRGNHEMRGEYAWAMDECINNFQGKSYGSFTWKGTRWVVLDCGEDKPDNNKEYFGMIECADMRKEETLFLQKELTSKAFRKAQSRILLSHVPLWGNVDSYQPGSELWRTMLEKAPFNVCITGHVHKFNYLPPNDKRNYPEVIGGGPYIKDKWLATVMILEQKNNKMHLKVIDVNGLILIDIDV